MVIDMGYTGRDFMLYNRGSDGELYMLQYCYFNRVVDEWSLSDTLCEWDLRVIAATVGVGIKFL